MAALAGAEIFVTLQRQVVEHVDQLWIVLWEVQQILYKTKTVQQTGKYEE